MCAGLAREDRGPQVGRASDPGRTSSALPTAAAAWASLLPSWGRPCCAAKRDAPRVAVTADRGGVEGLDARRGARGDCRRSGGRAGPRPARTGGYGTRGWAGTARPPWSWIASMDQRRLLSGGTRSLEEQPQEVAAAGRDLLARRRPRTARPRSAAIVPRGERGVDPLVVRDRDDVEEPLPSTWSRISATDAVPSEASVWMCRSARPRRSSSSAASCRPSGRSAAGAAASPARRRGRARSGGTRPTTAPGRRR